MLEVELAGLTQCARCDSINSVPSASVIISLHLCGCYLREYLSAGRVYTSTYGYVRLCAYKEWLDAFPGVRDYVNTRGQVWNKISPCPKSHKKHIRRECCWIRTLSLFNSSTVIVRFELLTLRMKDCSDTI